jgi:hypothetical protein
MGKKIGLSIVAVAALLSCENPIQSGLGSKVDITVPTITMTTAATISYP